MNQIDMVGHILQHPKILCYVLTTKYDLCCVDICFVDTIYSLSSTQLVIKMLHLLTLEVNGREWPVVGQ